MVQLRALSRASEIVSDRSLRPRRPDRTKTIVFQFASLFAPGLRLRGLVSTLSKTRVGGFTGRAITFKLLPPGRTKIEHSQ